MVMEVACCSVMAAGSDSVEFNEVTWSKVPWG